MDIDNGSICIMPDSMHIFNVSYKFGWGSAVSLTYFSKVYYHNRKSVIIKATAGVHSQTIKSESFLTVFLAKNFLLPLFANA